MKKVLILLLLMPIAVFTHAQQKWSLEKCIRYALDNNIQLKQQSLQLKNAEITVQQDKFALVPNLNAGASHGYNWGKNFSIYSQSLVNDQSYSDNFHMSSSVNIFDGFQKLNKLKQSRVDLEANKKDIEKSQNDISLNIATAYLQILFYTEALKVSENQLSSTDLQIERVKKLVNVGNVAQGELYNIQAQRANEHSQVVETKNNLDLAYLTLSQMLDLPTKEGFEIETPEISKLNPALLAINTENVFATALEKQPQIKSSELKIKSAEYAVKQAQGTAYPSLSLQGSLGTTFSSAAKLPPAYDKTKPFADQIKDNFNKSLSLSLSIPIFNGFSSRSGIARAKLNVENARLAHELNKNQLRKTIQQSYADAKAAFNKYEASQTGIEATREALRYAEGKYSVGVLNSVDYNNAKINNQKAESSYLQAKYDFLFKNMVLDFYMGQPLKLNY